MNSSSNSVRISRLKTFYCPATRAHLSSVPFELTFRAYHSSLLFQRIHKSHRQSLSLQTSSSDVGVCKFNYEIIEIKTDALDWKIQFWKFKSSVPHCNLFDSKNFKVNLTGRCGESLPGEYAYLKKFNLILKNLSKNLFDEVHLIQGWED